jgi:hypothetical protein
LSPYDFTPDEEEEILRRVTDISDRRQRYEAEATQGQADAIAEIMTAVPDADPSYAVAAAQAVDFGVFSLDDAVSFVADTRLFEIEDQLRRQQEREAEGKPTSWYSPLTSALKTGVRWGFSGLQAVEQLGTSALTRGAYEVFQRPQWGQDRNGELLPEQAFESPSGVTVSRARPTAAWTDIWQTTDLAQMLSGADAGGGFFVGEDSEARKRQRDQALAYRGSIIYEDDEGERVAVGDTPGRSILGFFYEPGTDAYNNLSGVVDSVWALSMPTGAEVAGPIARVVGAGLPAVTKGSYRSVNGLTNFWTPWIRAEKAAGWLESNAGREFTQRVVDLTNVEDARQLAPRASARTWNRMINATDDVQARQVLQETLGAERGLLSTSDFNWSRWSDVKSTVMRGTVPRLLGVERGFSRRPGRRLVVGMASDGEITETVKNAIDWFKLLKIAPEDRQELLTRFTNAILEDKANVDNILVEMQEVFVDAFARQGIPPEPLREIFTRQMNNIGEKNRYNALDDEGVGDIYDLVARKMLFEDETTGEIFTGIPDRASGWLDSEHRRWTISMPDPDAVIRLTKNFNWLWRRKAQNKLGQMIDNPQLPAEFLDEAGKPRMPTALVDFIHNELWKPLALNTGGYAFRVTGEGLGRQMFAPGKRSGLFHPAELISSLMVRGNSRFARWANSRSKYIGSLEGDLWYEGLDALTNPKSEALFNEHFDEIVESVGGGMRAELDPGVMEKVGFNLGSWSTATRNDPEFFQGMADNIHLLANDRISRLIANEYSVDEIIELARQGDKTVLDAIKDLQTRHASRNVTDWDTGLTRRASMKLFDANGDIIEFAVRNIIETYTIPRIQRFTGGDRRLLDVIANGDRFGLFRPDPDGDDIFAFGRMVEGMFGPESRNLSPLSRGNRGYAEQFYDVISEVVQSNPDAFPKLVKYRVSAAGYRPDQVPAKLRRIWNTYRQFTNHLFANLLTRPDQFLNRSPVWRRFYHQGIDLLLPQLDDGEAIKIIENISDAYRRAGKKGDLDPKWASRYVGSAKVWNRIVDMAEGRIPATGTRSLEEVSLLARGFAADETQKLLYDVAEKGNYAASASIVSPFISAWGEGLRRWSKNMLTHPQKTRQMIRSFQGLADADPDNNGQGIFYKHPTTNEWVVDYPIAAMSNPVIAAISTFFITTPFAGPVIGAGAAIGAGVYGSRATQRAEEAGVEAVAVGSLRSGNIALTVSPGMGPGIQLPLTWVLDRNWIPNSDDVSRFLLPYGPPAGGALGAFTPSWLSKFTDVFTNDPNSARYYADAKIQAFDALYMTGKYDRMDEQSMADLDADASEFAKYIVAMRSLGQFVGPLRPNIELRIPTRFEGQINIGDVELMVKEGDVRNVVVAHVYRLLQDEDYNSATRRFLEMFGDESIGFLIGKTYSNVDGLQASREFGDWVNANPDIVNNAPDVYAYFAGDVSNTFDFYTFGKQIRIDDRGRYTDPRARLEDSEAVAGRALYMERVFSSGLGNNPLVEEDLRQYRNFLEESLPGFRNELLYLNADQVRIRRLQDALELDATQGNPAAEGMREYFQYRDEMIRVAQARRTELGRTEVDEDQALTGDFNSDLRSVLRIAGFKIARENPAFAKVWSEVLFTEVDI